MGDLRSGRSVRKSEKEEGQKGAEEEVKVEEEVQGEKEEETEEKMEPVERDEAEGKAEEESGLESFGTFSNEHLWETMDIDGSRMEDLKAARTRLISVSSPSLSPTLPLTQASSASISKMSSSRASSQKSTAPARPFREVFPGLSGQLVQRLRSLRPHGCLISKHRHHSTHPSLCQALCQRHCNLS